MTNGQRWLPRAWRLWAVYAALMTLLLAVSLPQLFAALQQPCLPATVCAAGQMPPDIFAALPAAGLSPAGHAAIMLAFVLAFDSLLGLALAATLYWQRRGDWAALALAVPLVSHAVAFPNGLLLLERAYPALHPLTRLPDFFVICGWFAFFLVFPDGRFVPRWGRWLVPAWVAVAGLNFFYDLNAVSGAIAQVVSGFFVSGFALALGFQAYRFWRVSGPTQRAQARWVIFCLAVVLAGQYGLLPALRLALADANRAVAFYMSEIASTLLGPVLLIVGFWLAILRSRLWDIDIIIRRTLIYAVLSGLLALAYFGSVVVLQTIFSALTGQSQSALVTVLSTLTIAGLFVPLRARVQAVIDRRLYRRKYDATRTLAAFAASLRDETNLDQLTAHLAAVVDETMQPASVGLWLSGEAREH